MKRNYRFIKALIKLRLSQLMTFRMGFFGPFLIDSSLFVIQLFAFGMIYSNIDTVGGWGQGEMMIFIGTYSLINGLNMVIYFFGVISIPEKVKSGEMDLYLTKPVNPLLRISFENMNPGSLPLIPFSILIIIYGVSVSGIAITVLGVIWYVLTVIAMTLLYYDMEVIIRTLSFFLISGGGITLLEEAGLSLCMQIPGVIMKGMYKLVFYVFLPYGIIATIPTQILVNSISWRGIVYGYFIVVVFTAITFRLWNYGVRHYHSASS
ncbi:MAG: ABC transporter permease [Lachnospiraceae bacterium]